MTPDDLELHLSAIPEQPGKARLKLDCVIDRRLALKILGMLGGEVAQPIVPLQPAHNYGRSKANSAYQAFADKLKAAMTKNKLSASEVARRVWGTTKDSRGYTVARNRDRIGHYLSGASYPEEDNLVKLAGAIGVSVEDLRSERP